MTPSGTDNLGMNINDTLIKAEPMDNALSPAYNRNVYTTTPSPLRNSVSPNIPHHLLQMTTISPPTYNNQQSAQNTFSSSAYTPFNQTATYPIGIATTSQHPSFTTNNFEMRAMSTKCELPPMSTMNVSSLSYAVPLTVSGANAQQPLQQSNIPTTTTESNSLANLSSLFNLDAQQFTQLNSTELNGLSFSSMDETYTTAAAPNHIDATATVMAVNGDDTINGENNMEYDNMTDSFIKRCVIKELNNLL